MSPNDLTPTAEARVRGEIKVLPRKFSQKYQSFYREETSDLAMIKDCERNYTAVYSWIKEHPGCSVLDLGANVGHFSKLALQHGAGMVVPVEADHTNAAMVEMNINFMKSPPRYESYIGAVVREANESGTVEFFTANSKQSACSGSTIQSSVKRNGFTVKAITLKSLVEKYSPEVIKCDIEGGEYDLFRDGVPDCVKVLALETHLSTQWMKDQEEILIRSLQEDWIEVFRQDNIAFSKLFAIERVFIRK